MGAFLDGYDLAIIAGTFLLIVLLFDLSASEISWIGGAAFAGMMLGALVFGRVTDRIGRRGAFLFALVLFVVGSLVSALAGRVAALVFGPLAQPSAAARPATPEVSDAVSAHGAAPWSRDSSATSSRWPGTGTSRAPHEAQPALSQPHGFELPALLAEFRRERPGVDVLLRSGTAETMARMLDSDELDVAFATATDEPLPQGTAAQVLSARTSWPCCRASVRSLQDRRSRCRRSRRST